MSEIEKFEEVSRFDSISTEELQEILRKHAHGELNAEPNTDELSEIMEVLSVRRQKEEPHAFHSDEEAFADFCEHYMPKEENAKPPKVVRFPSRIFKTAAAVLAIVLILALGTTATANAFDYDIWGRFANWTKEIFHFTDLKQGTTATEPDKENNLELKSLQDALTQYKVTENLIPAWLPEGYTNRDLQIMESPRGRTIHAVYEKNASELIIQIRQTIGVPANQIEKNDDLLEVYTVDGVEYYIFSNTETLQAAWSIGEFECMIGGNITLEEMKLIIDSI